MKRLKCNTGSRRTLIAIAAVGMMLLAVLGILDVWPWLQTTARSLLVVAFIAASVSAYRYFVIHAPDRVRTQFEESSKDDSDIEYPTDVVRMMRHPPMPRNPPTVHRKEKSSKLVMIKRVIVWMAGSTFVIVGSLVVALDGLQITLWLLVMTVFMVIIEYLGSRLSILSTALRKMFDRTPDDGQKVLAPDEEKYLYYDDPHLTMFVNRVTLQILLWVATLISSWWLIEQGYMSSGWNFLAQYIITQVNIYFIVRAHITWSGIKHKITKLNYIRTQQEDLFFFVRRTPTLSVIKATLVKAERGKRSLLEYWFFKERGTIELTEQDSESKPRTIRYVKYPDKFIAAINDR